MFALMMTFIYWYQIIGVKPSVAKDEFSDLLGAQGFTPKAHDKGHVSINEMRREEIEKTTDPIKLKVRHSFSSFLVFRLITQVSNVIPYF